MQGVRLRFGALVSLVAGVAAASILLSISGCSKSSESGSAGGGILIGEYGALSGSQSTFGSSTDDGVKMAVNEVNSAGGVNGAPVQYKVYDDQSQSDQARAVVTRLIDNDKVTSLIGEVASSNSLAAAPVAERAKVPMITPASTNPKVTKVGDYIFRTCFIDPFQGAVMATFAMKNLHLKRAAIFYDNTSDYSVGLANFFENTFTKLGGTVVIKTSYKAGDPDFRAQLASMKQDSPDLIYIPGYYTEVGTIARQAREQGLNVPLMGGDGWDSPKLFESGGSALQNCYFSNHYSVQSTDPNVQKFVTAYKQQFNNKVPDAMAALAYDATHILLNAYSAAGTPANGNYDDPAYRAKLRDAIANTKNYVGVTGKITLGPTRDAVKPAVVLQIKGGDYKYITTIAPESIPS